MRNLMRIGFSRSGGRIDLTFRANAFVYHMVRNTVGTLVDIGTGRIGLAEAANLLPQRDRSRAGATAPACGLTLAAIDFGPAHDVPRPMAIDV